MRKYFLAGVMQGSSQAKATNKDSLEQQDYRSILGNLVMKYDPSASFYDPMKDNPIIQEVLEKGEKMKLENDPRDPFEDNDLKKRVWDENMRGLSTCHCLIAYLPIASMGTGLEMFLAKQQGVKVYTISPMTSNWVVCMYSDKVFSDITSFETWFAQNV